MIDTSSIPANLREIPQWVGWRREVTNGKQTKVPYQARQRAKADTTDPAHRASFPDALAAMNRYKYDGVGIVLDNGLAGVDIDHCRDPQSGEVAPWAEELITPFEGSAYMEASPSGTGVHIIGRGRVPGDRRKTAYCDGAVEMYHSGRFFTVTGDVLRASSLVGDITDGLTTVYQTVFTKPEPKRAPAIPAAPLNCDDSELFEAMYRASNGARNRALANGDDSAHNGDKSVADLVFCDLLASYTRCDAGRMDRMFRSSGRMRPKWDERRGESTWGARTIEKAIARCTWMYDPAHTQPPAPAAPAPVDTSDEVAVLRAELAELRAEVAQIGPMREEIAYLKDVVNTQRIRIQTDELEKRAYRSHLGTDADVLIAVAKEVDWRVAAERVEDDGSVYLPYDAVVTRLVGKTAPEHLRASVKARVTRALAKADASNVLSKRTEQRLVTYDEETGKYLEEPQHRRHTFVRWGTDLTTMIESLAEVTRPEDAPKRGGWRPRCPEHPKAAVITTHRCSVCNRELKPDPDDPTPPEDTNLYQPEEPAQPSPDDTSLSYIPTAPTVVAADNTNLSFRADTQVRCTFTPFGCQCIHPAECAEIGKCTPAPRPTALSKPNHPENAQ